jgi:hypothetical protein
MNLLELAAVGALGAAGLGLVGIGVQRARRRRAAARRRAAESGGRRRIRIELDEDPIVAAMVGGTPDDRRRP